MVFGIITLVIGLPRGVQLAYDYVHLRSGLIRPPVPLDQERAVLIVGTMGEDAGFSLHTHRVRALAGASAASDSIIDEAP